MCKRKVSAAQLQQAGSKMVTPKITRCAHTASFFGVLVDASLLLDLYLYLWA